MDDLFCKANLVLSFGTCFFSWFCGIEKLEEFPKDKVFLQKLDVTDFLYWFQITPIRAANIWVLFFRLQRHPSRIYSRLLETKWWLLGLPSIIPIVSVVWERFHMIASNMIVPIVRIELNSFQAIEVVSVVRVVCDRLGSVSIWSSWSSEHFLRRLGRLGWSGRSYGNQGLLQRRCVYMR